jgi:hypothetical protein
MILGTTKKRNCEYCRSEEKNSLIQLIWMKLTRSEVKDEPFICIECQEIWATVKLSNREKIQAVFSTDYFHDELSPIIDKYFRGEFDSNYYAWYRRSTIFDTPIMTDDIRKIHPNYDDFWAEIPAKKLMKAIFKEYLKNENRPINYKELVKGKSKISRMTAIELDKWGGLICIDTGVNITINNIFDLYAEEQERKKNMKGAMYTILKARGWPD